MREYVVLFVLTCYYHLRVYGPAALFVLGTNEVAGADSPSTLSTTPSTTPQQRQHTNRCHNTTSPDGSSSGLDTSATDSSALSTTQPMEVDDAPPTPASQTRRERVSIATYDYTYVLHK